LLFIDCILQGYSLSIVALSWASRVAPYSLHLVETLRKRRRHIAIADYALPSHDGIYTVRRGGHPCLSASL